MGKRPYSIVDKGGGLQEFEGAMSDMIVPSAVTVNTDCTVVTYTITSTTYSLAITWSGDNITAITKTEVV